MSYKLEKPYTEKQRLNFIVTYNHNQGLRLEETSTALYALEPNEIMVDDEPTLNLNYEIEQNNLLKEQQKTNIQKQLDDLDKKRVRAICEPSMKSETQSWLEYYNEQIVTLRNVMAEL